VEQTIAALDGGDEEVRPAIVVVVEKDGARGDRRVGVGIPSAR
jgi:hypothetical protein